MTDTFRPLGDRPADCLGRIIAINGSQAIAGLLRPHDITDENSRATVGKFLSIRSGASILIGMITEVSIELPGSGREQGYRAAAKLDLMGEILRDSAGGMRFQRGVASYPVIGDETSLMTNAELRLIYDASGPQPVNIGSLQQDSSIGAYVNGEELVNKHFAVLGTTGVGKSSGVAVILLELLRTRPDLRMFLIDAHNEYGRFFGDSAQVFNPRNVRLPFWLFNFEEIVDVFFGGRPGVEEEVEILSEVIPIAKGSYTQYRGGGSGGGDRLAVKRTDPKSTGFTVDTPVPYRLADLVALIDERMGKLENRSSRIVYHRLITRIELVRNDPRYAFMFDNANVGGDTMGEVLSQLFRMPANGKPMGIMQLAGFPSEIIDAMISVLCRMAFDFGLWSDGAVPLLVVCEEAHRYASVDRTIGFGPTRRAISRIAKEGRKYGVFLGLVTQRPAELDPTILSQCSTFFAMRLSNDRDQALVRSAVSDAASSLLTFLPSLGTREAFAFGEGVALPTRLKFTELPAHLLPKNERETATGVPFGTPEFINSVIERWRGATMSKGGRSDDGDPLGQFNDIPSIQPSALDSDRFRILKKPITADAPAAAPPSRWPLK